MTVKIIDYPVETIFTNFNMILALITLIIITIINPLMRPTNKTEIKEIDTNVFNLSNKNNDFLDINQKAEHSHKSLNLIDLLVYLLGYAYCSLFFTFS